jgi:hypothetical protein
MIEKYAANASNDSSLAGCNVSALKKGAIDAM